MKAWLDDRQRLHDPQSFLVSGVQRDSPEQPERIARLKAGGEAAGLTFEAPEDHGMGPIGAVHSAEYLVFLETIHDRWTRVPGAGPEVVPNVHPRGRTDSYPASPVGQAGYHQADTACPIGRHTWEAAYWSAQCAVSAADHLGSGARSAYALCRPPGHHAYADQAGGFCFLNNAGIAAERLREGGARVAILDVDVHHGNGTQGMFYARNDILTVSIHADPAGFYPFYWGHTAERGAGQGLGFNLNLPLPRGTDDVGYEPALEAALKRIRLFGADVIVVALGLDAHESDPFQGLALSTDGFTRIARALSATGLPLLLVQEGGYLSEALSANLTAFLRGIDAA